MFALEAASGRELWTSGGPAGGGWSGWNAIADGRMYVVAGEPDDAQRDEAIAEMGAYLREHDPSRVPEFEQSIENRDIRLITALDSQTGELLWQRAVDVTGTMGWCSAVSDTLVYGAGGSSGKNWAGWPGSMGTMAALDATTGELLWSVRDDFRFQPVVTSTTIFAEPRAYDLRSGARLERTHPITGEASEFVWVRAGKHCGGYTGAENFIFGRNMFVGYYDTQRDNGLYSFVHSRISCNSDVASGGGMMIKPPMALGCTCTWSQPFTIALAPVEEEPEAPFMYFHPGEALPVDELRLNFGETGDLRDQAGRLWLKPERPTTGYIGALLCDWQPEIETFEGVNYFWRDMRRSQTHTPIAGTETPFVFTSYARGMKQVTLPLTSAEHGAATYTVRMAFAAPPGDTPGSRVFDVTLNGEKVLADFDIVAAAGEVDTAVWREFTVATEDNLVLGFSSKLANPELQHMPLLCGLEILRHDDQMSEPTQ